MSPGAAGGRELVVCSLEAWDDVWRRNQFLVAGLLDTDPGLRVLFVEPPADPIFELARRERPGFGRGLHRHPELDRLWTLHQTKVAPRRAGSFVDGLLTRGVVAAARRLGFTRPLLWINDPGRAPLLERTGWPAVYDITDDWLVAERGARERERIGAAERLLMRRCAAVVVCSPHLERVKGAIRPVTLVPNAVDAELYRRLAPRPPDLPPGPTAVYVGTLHEDRLDVDLCVRTARRLAGIGTLVFVGPDALAEASRARLRGEPNVALLGARPHLAIPGYLQHADALVVPHVVDEFTDSLDPIKLYEYLAVGRPIVSTPVAGFRERPESVTVAPASDFADAVAHRLTEPGPGPVAPVDLPTWALRVEQFRAVLQDVERSAR